MEWILTWCYMLHFTAWCFEHDIEKHLVIHKPFKLPSNVGFVATFSPGWGIKKQPMSLKHDLMCLLTCISSECCFSVMRRRFSKIWLPPTDPYGASYGKLQSRTKNTNLWNKIREKAECSLSLSYFPSKCTWPSIHCLYFIHACKICSHTLKFSRQWKSTLKADFH